mmetsp:Transcript_43407/g.99459  ORF Transcript_43407/g.99459 Transcript_43407/m.99459 type:complete len:352 (+) Transcript_43407:497-1552(+)
MVWGRMGKADTGCLTPIGTVDSGPYSPPLMVGVGEMLPTAVTRSLPWKHLSSPPRRTDMAKYSQPIMRRPLRSHVRGVTMSRTAAPSQTRAPVSAWRATPSSTWKGRQHTTPTMRAHRGTLTSQLSLQSPRCLTPTLKTTCSRMAQRRTPPVPTGASPRTLRVGRCTRRRPSVLSTAAAARMGMRCIRPAQITPRIHTPTRPRLRRPPPTQSSRQCSPHLCRTKPRRRFRRTSAMACPLIRRWGSQACSRTAVSTAPKQRRRRRRTRKQGCPRRRTCCHRRTWRCTRFRRTRSRRCPRRRHSCPSLPRGRARRGSPSRSSRTRTVCISRTRRARRPSRRLKHRRGPTQRRR